MRPRLLQTWVALIVAWVIFPCASELLENAVHLTLEGHLAHSAPAGDAHGPAPPEHGCSGAFHVCSCCHTTAFALEKASAVAQAPGLGQRFEGSNTPVRRDPLASGLDHPPRA